MTEFLQTLLGQLASQIGNILTSGGSGSGITNSDVADATSALWAALTGLTQFIQDVFQANRDAWGSAGGPINDGASGLGDLAYNEQQAWNHLLSVILPNTVRWILGKVAQEVDEKIAAAVVPLERKVAENAAQIEILANWRAGKVDPDLAEFAKVYSIWTSYAAADLVQLNGWINHPFELATPLAGYMAQTLNTWWGGVDGVADLKRTALLMAAAYQLEPDVIANAFDAWLAAKT